MLNPGDAAPDFTLTGHDGVLVRLTDQRGKIVVLWFYPKADTPGWTREGCGFRDLAYEFTKKNAVIYGASFDTPDENKAFADKFSFNFVLLTVTSEMALAYGAGDAGQTAFAKRVGVVIGPDGLVKEWLQKVDASSYPTDVLARI